MKVFFKTLTVPCLLLAFLLANNAGAQPGCTDPQANNYDPMATENDGSCTYPTTNYPPVQIANLPASLEESSGLAFFNDRLWTHLDGGNDDQLYSVDTLSGALLQTVTIPNSENKDWEDLAEDDEHLYIGDFGNNFGNRTDLRIYKIKKSGLEGGNPVPELIEFSFSDQTDFSTAQNAHNYDCEAFFFWQDSLHLFSKNWLDFKTRHYVLPATPGSHVAVLRDSLNTQGQVTAADISDDGVVLLLGYNIASGDPFLWLLFDYAGQYFFSGNKRRIALGSVLATSQVEGIAFRDATRGFISSERLSLLPPKLLGFDIAAFLPGPVSAANSALAHSDMAVFPNPASETIQVRFAGLPAGEVQLSVVDQSGKKVVAQTVEVTGDPFIVPLSISDLPAGNYVVLVRRGKASRSLIFRKQ